ncbi:M1 family metallopeptidase [Muriicola sp. Z0-33]|uniref:M1 family metallopeptidase n=1 Tax=Muriicola sp. Z0-33 TaxID=2816957 RepID=UPI0022389D93|nr:M1 family metallopeptidase [Muriicola sp. Z0-33]MCW5515382.1 M1 family metallopeptidase [Muriicola sp. Z0-33]
MKSLLLVLSALILSPCISQNQPGVDFTHGAVSLSIDPEKREIKGEVIYSFHVLNKVDSVFLDARNMAFNSVLLNNRNVNYNINGKHIIIRKKFKAGKTYQLGLRYNTVPKQTVYFVGWDDDQRNANQLWTQGQGKYTSHWLPSFDDMNEKVAFDLSISFDANYEVAANGKLEAINIEDGIKTWSYNMNHPMSSYLLAFAIGDYDKKELVSSSKIPLNLYYYPADSSKAEPTYRYTKKIFDFLEKEIGFAYPWQNYKQLPVRDFLYAGMENTGTTLFSDAYVIDSIAFVDKNYVNVNAHEMAHQWFGNLVTEKNGKHHWLHEGFATYYAYLAEKEVFGEEYFYWKLYESARALHNLEREDRGEALTDPGASSLTFYEKGAWALQILRDTLGEKAFKAGIVSYLEKYKFGNAGISDFIKEMEEVSKRDLSDFRMLWLEGTDFPYEKAITHLKENSVSLSTFFELKWELSTSNQTNEEIIRTYWKNSESPYLKKNILAQYHKSLSEDFIKDAFNTNDIKIRQALAIAMNRIPEGLTREFESLLDDKSYVTLENALYKNWVHNPQKRVHYLDKTKDIEGLPNKNVRLLWLLLASLTKDYADAAVREQYMEELKGYTAPKYPFEVRQFAFTLISEVFAMSDDNLKDLVNASVHHAWQFRKYARTLLDKTLTNEKQKQRLEKLSGELKGEELRYIRSKLQLK